jgi:hypothetical protein
MSTCLPQNDQKKQKKQKYPKERGTNPPLLSSSTKDKKQCPYEHLLATNKLLKQPKKKLGNGT